MKLITVRRILAGSLQ